MTGRTQPAVGRAPEWMLAEMPPGYRTRLVEIQRLSADLHAMERVGSVLWENGEALKQGVSELFAALKCDVGPAPGSPGLIAVTLGDSRRLLLLVSNAAPPVEKTSGELAQAFQAVQFAIADDRVVFVPGNDPAAPPANRPASVLPDALAMLQRMGVDVVTTATLFGLWMLWHEDPQKARKALERLHAQDGGSFTLTPR